MQDWYNSLKEKQTRLVWTVSILMIAFFFPIGIPTSLVLLYLHYGKNEE